MTYKDKIIVNITQLEDYARTCFVQLLKLPNGQGKTVNEFIDTFMELLTDGEYCFDGGEQITLDDCLCKLLPECRQAFTAKETYLYSLVSDFIHDNLHQCEDCGEWYNMEKDGFNDGVCQDCQAHRNANDPDTIADFLNDCEREYND